MGLEFRKRSLLAVSLWMVFKAVELDEIILGMKKEEHLSMEPGCSNVGPRALPQSAQQVYVGNWRKRTRQRHPPPRSTRAETLRAGPRSQQFFLTLPRQSYREGNGTPLHYFCLENPMGGGAWWASVHGVPKSRTRLSDFTFTFHFHALEKEMATHSSVLAWRIPGTAESGGLPSVGSHRVGHD